MWNIFFERLSFAPEAVVGVGLIVVYFIWMISMACTRVFKGEHMDH